MEPAVESYLGLLRRRADDAAMQVDTVAAAFNLCESPIERQMLLAYLHRYPTTALYDDQNKPVFLDEDLDKESWVMVIPQFTMHVKNRRFRPDFCFLQLTQDLPNNRVKPLKKVVVELDGHDFHERTKEQARYDRSRDRFMLRHGFYVLRYTGSEVFKDADAVAEEIRDFVMTSEAAA